MPRLDLRLVLATVLALCFPAATGAATPAKTTLLSLNQAGSGAGNGHSSPIAISANGRFVLFQSDAGDLVAGDINYTTDVFVRDVKTGTTTLVSVNQAGTTPDYQSSEAIAITPNGRFVLFVSNSDDLVANDSNLRHDAFVRDLKKGTTTLVSVNQSGRTSAERSSWPVAISPNGRFVAFNSDASDLVANDTNGDQGDGFVRDLHKGTTTLASVNQAGTSGNSWSGSVAMTANGRFVLLGSGATDMDASLDEYGTGDTFVRDRQKGTTTLVSLSKNGLETAAGHSYGAAISPNGRFVLFNSDASDIADNDTNAANGAHDAFVRDLLRGTSTLVTVNHTGTATGDAASWAKAMSANGRFVLFESEASDLVASDSNAQKDVFVRDLWTGETALVSVNRAGTDAGNGASESVALSASGRFVLFGSDASNLVAHDRNGASDAFVRDLKTGKTTLVSVNQAGTRSGTGNQPEPLNFSFPTAMTASGRFVTFLSFASDLTADVSNGTGNAFVRNLQ